MKSLRSIAVLGLVTILTVLSTQVAAQSADQWRAVAGPREDIITLFSHGIRVFAGTLSGGVYRAANKGGQVAEWTPASFARLTTARAGAR